MNEDDCYIPKTRRWVKILRSWKMIARKERMRWLRKIKLQRRGTNQGEWITE